MDEDIATRIDRLVEEEHRLHAHETPTDEDRQRLQSLEVQLDQCWDLLRQRRAKRAAGKPVDETAVQPAEVVEHYQQ